MSSNSSDLDNFFLAAEKGNLEKVIFFLPIITQEEKEEKNDALFMALKKASRNGHLDIVKLLLPHLGHEKFTYQARPLTMAYAAEEGHLNIVEFLLPNSSQEDRGRALDCAIRCNHLNIVTYLAPLTDIKDFYESPLSFAAEYGHFDIFQYLLPFCDPKSNKNDALRRALRKGRQDMIDILIPISDCEEVMNTIHDFEKVNFLNYLKNYEAKTTKNYLKENIIVQKTQKPKTPKKI